MNNPVVHRNEVAVDLGNRSYPIEITSGGFGSIGRAIRSRTRPTHVVVVSDAAVDQPWTQRLIESLSEASDTVASPTPTTGDNAEAASAATPKIDRVTVPSGEPSKCVQQYQRLLQFCLDRRVDRRSVLVAIGGGVVGDLGGFVAASYTRGIRFVQVPTTLLAMVDSSVGGKTGINLPGGKNMVGAFWQPELVCIETDVLQTLGQREYVSGIAEVLKYGVICDAEFFRYLEDHIDALRCREAEVLRHAVARSCEAKAAVVSEDERETSGRRAILNYGHTFAHAIEATAGYGTWLHGEAVAIGMNMAGHLACSLGMWDQASLERQTRLIQRAGLPLVWPDADAGAMIEAMSGDKKVAHGKLRFILPDRIGNVRMCGGIDDARVTEAIEAAR